MLLFIFKYFYAISDIINKERKKDKNSRTTLEMENENCRPKIVKKIENINNYDKIVIGCMVVS